MFFFLVLSLCQRVVSEEWFEMFGYNNGQGVVCEFHALNAWVLGEADGGDFEASHALRRECGLEMFLFDAESHPAEGVGLHGVEGDSADADFDVGAFDVHVAALHLV